MSSGRRAIVLFLATITALAMAPGAAPVGAQSSSPGSAEAGGATAAQTPPVTLVISGQLQTRFTYADPEGEDAIGSFGIRRARVSLSGLAYERFRYVVQFGLEGATPRLVDANIRYGMAPMAVLWVGQGKAPFGRQQLTSSANLHMVDRSVVDGRFTPGRQQGIALMGQSPGRTFEYGAGIYNGHGINTPNENDRFMYVGRAVWTPLGAYPPVESAFDYPESPRVAFGVAGMRNTLGDADTRVGITRLGLEGAFKIRGFNSTAEFFREWLSPAVGGRLDTDGWHVQAGYLFPGRRHELAGRWGVISPDTPADTDTVELGVGHSLYLVGHRAKLQTDVRTMERRALDSTETQVRVQLQILF